MSAIAAITVFDGAGTPVTHTLSPVSVSKTDNVITAVWRESNAALPVEAQISLTLRQSTNSNGVVKSQFTMDVPVMESVSGQNAAGYTASPKVAFIDRNEWTSYAHPRSTVTSRRLARQLLVNFSGNVSTTVTPTTTGFLPDAVDQLFAPT